MSYSWKRNLAMLWLGSFLVSMAYSISFPFLPIFLQNDLHITEHLEIWTGIIFAVTFLASSFIAPFWGSLADKYGRKLMMLRAGLCLSLAYFLYFLVQTPYEMLFARILEGLLAGYIPSAIALVATQTPEKHVGYALGIISTAGASASVIGPLLGGVVSHWAGPRETFFVAGVMVLAAFVIAFLWVKEPHFVKSEKKRSSVWSDLKEAAANRNLMMILLLIFITSTSIMIVEPLLTIYVIQLGSSESSASLHSGIIFSAVGIATLIAAPVWGKLGSRLGNGKVLFVGLLGGAAGNVLQIAFTHLVGFGVLRFVYGLFFAAVFPALNASIVENTQPEFRGRAFSLNQTANQLGLVIGPLLGGILGSLLPIPYIFLINGIMLFVVAMLMKLPQFSFYKARVKEISS
ncbi:MFS transporter [Paenibacillus sp. GD4]|jgi:MFS transporter, DHA1 family, multidrug resistance protein|uniref:MFS transporter n=1 Tax=Paenibacillus sp. GD4 TaxID=3068890 RepID=UPI0027966C01|nr:MFS transporter [Paenibacillus sp. GD4]MDQ1913814.1 MFS transporter [Paenibacillus sp. GD4]